MKNSIRKRQEQEQKLLEKRQEFANDGLKKATKYFYRNEKPQLLALPGTLQIGDCALYQLLEMSHEGKTPRKEAFENILSAMRLPGVNFVYLILGDAAGVRLYFGLARDLNYQSAPALPVGVDVKKTAEALLLPSLYGNFRGSKVGSEQSAVVRQQLGQFQHWGMMEGLPKLRQKDEEAEFQGVDRLIRIMQGDCFCISIVATAIRSSELQNLEQYLYQLYDILNPLGKRTLQQGDSYAENQGQSRAKNSAVTDGKNGGNSRSETETDGTNKTDTNGWGKNDQNNGNSTTGSNAQGESWSKAIAESQNTGWSQSKQHGTTETQNVGENYTENQSLSVEFSDKHSQEWLKYLDEELFTRLNYSKNKGAFHTFISLAASDDLTFVKLRNTVQALFSSESDNRSPLNLYKGNFAEYTQNFQYPYFRLKNNQESDHFVRAALSQNVTTMPNKKDQLPMGYWLSAQDLAFIPQKEVVGLSLKEEVEFGLNPNHKIEMLDRIEIGQLIQSGNETPIPVCLDQKVLNKHIFVSGVTGSGKTTTCIKILSESNLPFLVLEPAKTEYRILGKNDSDLLIFTLGNNEVAPFLLNPFEFLPGENIVSRVDMIKASIEAAFDMEAAIPQIIEAALFQCYENYGWNIATNRNSRFADPFAEGVFAFPTLEDLMRNVEGITKDQGFDLRLQSDYIGSIRARLQGLMVGAKGAMLNTPRSMDFRALLEKKVIIELEEIRSPREKSLIMGFLLTNLNAALQARQRQSSSKGATHITLIEEAHRLLAKIEPGDHPSKKQGVETLCDMLAEVRKYGEALIIADQIPNKLASDVLKNTNTKVIHKIFARDDKEAIGNIMALEDEQKDFFSFLEVGRAIVLSEGFLKPVQVKIQPKEGTSTTGVEEVAPEQLRQAYLQFFLTCGRTVLPGFAELPNQNQDTVLQLLELLLSGELLQKWKAITKKDQSKEITQKDQRALHRFLLPYRESEWRRVFARLILQKHYAMEKEEEDQEKRYTAINDVLSALWRGDDLSDLRSERERLGIQ